MGGEVTPQSDLYSLGAMLYEMVTGRPPFLGDDSVAIIGQHINTPPVAPTWHNSSCPRALDALILRLLAKDPSERPESASDVLAALDAIDLAADVGAQGLAPLRGEEHSLDSLAGGVFVGRQREMGDLKACLEDALSGRGRLVTLVGEPGIGKTRTAQELATYAGLRGAHVLWGRSYEEQGVPPYWPWVQAIRSYVRERDPDQLRSEMGAGAADIAEVVSDVRERLPGLPAPLQLEPDQARFRLFDSIAAFLKTASQRQPLVLVLDDLHWADQPSLMLLQFVARELGGARLLVVGTYRDMELSRQHPLAEALGELTRERLFQRVLLRGLDQEDVGRFIEMASGVTPPSALVTSVYTQTEGNPLFVTEVVRLLVQEGELTFEKVRETDSWTIRIPEGVREVIGRSLNRLSERCNEALTVASMLGREFTLAQLRTLVEEVSEDRLFELLEEALAARVIEELPQSVGRYQFTHALIQETLAAELSLTRRVRFHARIAKALEDLYGDDADDHSAELAYHFAEAEAVLGAEKLARYSLLAGERALAAYAWEEALAHFQRALVAKEGQQIDDETAALLFGLGRAQSATLEIHQHEEVVASLSHAFEYYAANGDVSRAVAVATYPLPSTTIGSPGVAQFTSRALALVPPDSHEAGYLLSTYGRVLGTAEGDYTGAQAALGRALAIAQREGDIALEIRTLSWGTVVDLFYHCHEEGLKKCMRAIELVRYADDPIAEVNAHLYALFHRTITGLPEAANPHAAAALTVAEKLRDRNTLAHALWANELFCHSNGNWRAARDYSDRGLAVSSMDPRLLSSRVPMDYQLGDFGQGETHLERLLEALRLADPRYSGMQYAFTAMAITVISQITGDISQFDLAKSAAETVLSSPTVRPYFASVARVSLALMAVQQGDGVIAREQYGALESRRGTLLAMKISTDRVLGLLAQTMDDLEQAAAHFEDALAFCRKAGYRPELAWACCDYADTLRERDDSGDKEKAITLLDESLAISSEVGMRPLMERVLSQREILKA